MKILPPQTSIISFEITLCVRADGNASYQASYTNPQSQYGSNHGSQTANGKEPSKSTTSYLNEHNLRRIPERQSQLHSYVQDKQAFEQVAVGKEGHRPDMNGMVWDMERRIDGRSSGEPRRR